MEEVQMEEELKKETNGTQIEDKEIDETQITDDKDSYSLTEVAPALIAVHPFNQSIAVAVGLELCIFNLIKNSPVSLADESKEMLHKDSIRALRFSDKGKLLVSAGDDKLVKIWSTETWQCLYTVNSEKRVSAVAISKDEQYVCFADKFGVGWIVDLAEIAENQSVSDKKAMAIFGHYCSIITSLEFSPDGQFIVSADRDFKIRVSLFPKNPLKGVHEIQSFCLGHSEFVSCLTFVHNSDFPQGFLLSGSGDSTVCLWDVTSGSLLCTSEVGREANLSEESHPAVIDLCASGDGSLVAVAIQSLQGILLLSCDLSAGRLSTLKVVPVPGETFIPTRLGMALSDNLLWMVTGASNLPSSKAASFARIRIVSGFNELDVEPKVLDNLEIPGGEQLLVSLHPKLELVSRTWKAALRSRELFKAREEVGSSEEFLCVCAFEPDNLWQLYDPLHDIWMTLPVFPSKIRHLAHFGIVSTGGKLYVLGGGSEAVDPLTGDQDGSFGTNEVWSYDPVMRKWAQCAPMLVARAMFACCVLDGKIVVAGGFTSCRKTIPQAEVYDPEKDLWVSIPDLPYSHDSACSGVVVGGRMHVVQKGLSMVQVLERPFDGWIVEDHGWLHGPMAVVKGVLYVMSHGLIYKQENGKRKVIVSASEVSKRISSAMIGLGGEIYVVGGVIGPDRCNRDIKPTSDVDVLTVGSERPIWRRVTPMSKCRGTILGCTQLKI